MATPDQGPTHHSKPAGIDNSILPGSGGFSRDGPGHPGLRQLNLKGSDPTAVGGFVKPSWKAVARCMGGPRRRPRGAIFHSPRCPQAMAGKGENE